MACFHQFEGFHCILCNEPLPPPLPINLATKRAEKAGEAAQYLPLAPLPDDESYIHGMEAGILHARLDGTQCPKPPAWEGTYRTSQAERLVAMARFLGYTARVRHSPDPYWTYISFELLGLRKV